MCAATESACSAATTSANTGMDALVSTADLAATSETLAAITDFRFALILRETYGWTLDRIEEWMTTASRNLLLG